MRWPNDRGGREPTIDWSKWDRLLGTLPDTQLARLIRCTPNAVLKRRRKLGVMPYQPRWGTPQASAPQPQRRVAEVSAGSEVSVGTSCEQPEKK